MKNDELENLPQTDDLRTIAEYVKINIKHLERFLGAAELCGYELVKTDTRPNTLQSSEVDGKDWTEDSDHENGNYQNKCNICDDFFVGHKRRRVCKSCSTPAENVRCDGALAAFDRIDKTLSFLRNMMNGSDELTALNIPSFKKDMDEMIKDMRVHGFQIRAALSQQKAEWLPIDVKPTKPMHLWLWVEYKDRSGTGFLQKGFYYDRYDAGKPHGIDVYGFSDWDYKVKEITHHMPYIEPTPPQKG